MKTVIEMAREAGLIVAKGFDSGPGTAISIPAGSWGVAEVGRLVELVRADEREQGQKWFDAVAAQHKQAILAEREACAKVCDRVIEGKAPDDIHSDGQWAALTLAAEIRARSNT